MKIKEAKLTRSKKKIKLLGIDGWLTFLLIFTPVCKPYAAQQIPLVDTLFDVWGMFVVFMLVILHFNGRGERLRVGGINKYIYVLCGLYVGFTLLNAYDANLGAISEVVRIILLPLYLSLVHKKATFVSICKKIFSLYFLLILVDCITIIWVNTGHLEFFQTIDRSFLGADNFVVFLLLPMFGTMHIISSYIDKRLKISTMVLFFVCLALKSYTLSLTAVCGMSAYLILITVWKRKKSNNYTGYLRTVNLAFIAAVAMTLLVPVIGLAEFALTHFGKNSIYSRINIWAHTLESIPNYLIVGLGKYKGELFKEYVNLPKGYIADHVHNSYLAAFIKWGIWGPCIFWSAYRYLIRLKYKDELYILLSYIISFLIIGVFEDYYMITYFFNLFVIYDEKNRHEEKASVR